MKHFLTFILFLSNALFATDSYQWLEEDSLETQSWVENQRAISSNYLSSLPSRDKIRDRLKEISEYETISLPERRQETLYFYKHRIGENKPVLVRQEGGKESVLVNPNTMKEEVVPMGFDLSPDGRYLCYGLSLAGSDQTVWRVIDLQNGKELPEEIDHIQFSSPTWDETSSTLFYIRDCKKLFQHQIDTDLSNDQLLYEAPEDFLLLYSEQVLQGRYLLIILRPLVAKHNQITLIDLKDPHFRAHQLIAPGEHDVSFVGDTKDSLFFITDENCCFSKLISTDLKSETTLIDEKESLLQEAIIVGDRIVCAYYKNAIAELQVFDMKGQLVDQIALPRKGSVSIHASKHSPILYYSFTDFRTPSEIYTYNVETKEHSAFFKPELNFDPSNYLTKQVWFTSKDQTIVSMFITYRKDLTITDKTPVLLYGYGGFGLSVTPSFRIDFLAWVESGGVLAIPNLRGGKEFGNIWYEQGRKHNKQNVFDDCISAAEYLISQGIGGKDSLAIFGSSNGGLLSGACLTQRPDLFKAAIVNKGVLDMLRFHLFTIGKYWICDFGNPDDPEDQAYLLSYSPYHNIRKQTYYPATLINTADHDDRVVPMHSYKFAAKLQEANESDHPILLRLEESCGHGGTNSKEQAISFGTDMLSFLFRELLFQERDDALR